MKALIRRSPYTPTRPAQDEVYLAPWLDWIDPVTGAPLTGTGYCYALCEDVPDTPIVTEEEETDQRLVVTNYTVTEHEREVPSETGEGTVTEKYWTAEYIGPLQSTTEVED